MRTNLELTNKTARVYRRLSLKTEKRKKNKRHKRDKDRGNA